MGGRIVVGVDGSESSILATRWAAQEAHLRDATLDLVSACDLPSYTEGYGYGPAAVTDDLAQELRKVAEENLAAALVEARAQARDARAQIRAVEGQAARVLLDASRNADLLVVGSRGLGGFRELLLGSIGQQCAHHATCPVVIVRAAAAVAG
jgi:nucleotide-binding universal stress UspA family protein